MKYEEMSKQAWHYNQRHNDLTVQLELLRGEYKMYEIELEKFRKKASTDSQKDIRFVDEKKKGLLTVADLNIYLDRMKFNSQTFENPQNDLDMLVYTFYLTLGEQLYR